LVNMEEDWRSKPPEAAQAPTVESRIMPRPPIERLRAICLALPEAVEKETWGDPTFRVGERIFAMEKRGDGRVSLWCKAPPGSQMVLVGADPERFFVPPYVGHKGWVGMRLDREPDWDEVAALVRRSYGLPHRSGLRRSSHDRGRHRLPVHQGRCPAPRHRRRPRLAPIPRARRMPTGQLRDADRFGDTAGSAARRRPSKRDAGSAARFRRTRRATFHREARGIDLPGASFTRPGGRHPPSRRGTHWPGGQHPPSRRGIHVQARKVHRSGAAFPVQARRPPVQARRGPPFRCGIHRLGARESPSRRAGSTAQARHSRPSGGAHCPRAAFTARAHSNRCRPPRSRSGTQRHGTTIRFAAWRRHHRDRADPLDAPARSPDSPLAEPGPARARRGRRA